MNISSHFQSCEVERGVPQLSVCPAWSPVCVGTRGSHRRQCQGENSHLHEHSQLGRQTSLLNDSTHFMIIPNFLIYPGSPLHIPFFFLDFTHFQPLFSSLSIVVSLSPQLLLAKTRWLGELENVKSEICLCSWSWTTSWVRCVCVVDPGQCQEWDVFVVDPGQCQEWDVFV